MKNNNIGLIKSEKISIVDNTLKFTWIVSVLIITNFTVIVSKLNELNTIFNSSVIIAFLSSVLIFLIMIYYIIEWKITNILYNEDRIIIYKSLIAIDLSEFLIKNVTGIVIEKNIIGKIFDVVRVKIYTNQISNKKEDLHIVLKTKKALELRQYILNKGILKNNEEINDFDNFKIFDLKINFSNILLHSLLSISLGNIIIIANIVYIIFSMIYKGTILNEVLYNFIGFAITIFTIAFPVIYSVFCNVLKYGNYKLKRYSNVTLIRYGIITTKDYIILNNQINGIIIKETLLSKLFKHNLIKIICSGSLNKKKELEFLIPMVSKAQTSKVLNIIFKDKKIDKNILSKNNIKYQSEFSVINLLLSYTALNMIIIPALMYFRINSYYIFIYLILSMLVIIVPYVYIKTGINSNGIVIKKGIILTTKIIIFYDKIKYFQIISTPINRLFNIYRLNIYISSKQNGRKSQTGYMSKSNIKRVKNNILNYRAT